jgi:hypothetical protein
MTEKVQLWRHVVRCAECEQLYDFVSETRDADAARHAELPAGGFEVSGDTVRCWRCVEGVLE